MWIIQLIIWIKILLFLKNYNNKISINSKVKIIIKISFKMINIMINSFNNKKYNLNLIRKIISIINNKILRVNH